MPLPLALLLGAGIALLAWRAGTLAPSGAIAAALVGTATLAGAGWQGGAVLLVFFTGSTLVSRLCPDPAAARGETKGGRRDAGQVLANGGAPALGALLGLGDPFAGLGVLTIGLAAAAADTWATALGGTSPRAPRHLLSGLEVPAGTSGGVTWRGTLGGMLGALSVAVAGGLAARSAPLAAAAIGIGTGGMLLDSLLGATVQARRHCPECDAATEAGIHHCGRPSVQAGGVAWITNDGVNALTTLAATLAGWAIVASMS